MDEVELIGRTSEEVRKYSGSKDSSAKVSLTKKGLYFNKAAVEMFNIKQGSYIHFIEGSTTWWFIVGAKDDGFIASISEKRSPGAGITSIPLLRFVLEKLGYRESKLPLTFYVQESADKTYQDKPMGEILFSKPIQHLLNQ